MATMKKMQRKGGKVSYKISFVHPKTKKWMTKTVRCSYKDALKIKADIEKDIAFGKIGKTNPDFRKTFFSQLKSRYIKDSSRNKTPKTTEREEIVLENFTSFLEKDIELSKITIEKIEESDTMDKVYATIVVEKDTQKGMIVGQKGAGIKRVGRLARVQMEVFSGKKIFLDLHVSVKKGWSKNKDGLEEFGYIV